MSDDLLGHQFFGEDAEGAERNAVVLLLNGGMMTYRAWAPVVEGLLDRYRVLGCDFRGQLMSPGLGHPRLETHAEDVLALLDALQLEAVHVLGTSFGGEVALLLAARYPERVRTLAVVTAADRTPPGMAEASRRAKVLVQQAAEGGDAGPFHDTLLEDVYSRQYREAHREQLAAHRQQTLPAAWYRGLLGILTSIEDFDLTPSLGAIHCPTLVVHAAQDAVMPTERVEALAAGIAGAELRVHPTSGHVLVVEDPAWLVRQYRAFLARAAAGD